MYVTDKYLTGKQRDPFLGDVTASESVLKGLTHKSVLKRLTHKSVLKRLTNKKSLRRLDFSVWTSFYHKPNKLWRCKKTNEQLIFGLVTLVKVRFKKPFRISVFRPVSTTNQ